MKVKLDHFRDFQLLMCVLITPLDENSSGHVRLSCQGKLKNTPADVGDCPSLECKSIIFAPLTLMSFTANHDFEEVSERPHKIPFQISPFVKNCMQYPDIASLDSPLTEASFQCSSLATSRKRLVRRTIVVC